MRIEKLTLFGDDLAAILHKYQSAAKSLIERSSINYDTDDETLNKIALNALDQVFKLKEVSIVDEPVQKESIEMNLNFAEAMHILSQGSTSGNLATFAIYTYSYSGSKDLLLSSNGGYSHYTIWGSLTNNEIKIIIPFPGTITESNVDSVKSVRDRNYITIKSKIEENNKYSLIARENLGKYISEIAEQIRQQKIRVKNTNDLL